MGLLPNVLARRPHAAEHDFTGLIVDSNGSDLENGQAVYGFIPVRELFGAALHCNTNAFQHRSFHQP